MPTVDQLRPEIDAFARQSVRDILLHRDPHGGCKGEPRCTAAGPSDVPEELWSTVDEFLRDKGFPDGDSTERDHCCDAFAQTFSDEWQARVKACK
jgi:hypothetical protein